MFYPEAEVVFRTAKDNNEQQIHDIELMIRNRVDLLVVSPNEAEVLAPVIEKAYGRGIPVILTDRKIHSDNYTAYIGADNYAIGHSVGEYIAARLQGKGKVVEVMGLRGSTPAGGAGEMSRYRGRGFGRRGLAAQGGSRAFRLDSCRLSGH